MDYSKLKEKLEEELLILLKEQKNLLVRAKGLQKSLGFSPEREKENRPKLQRELKKNIARINKSLEEIKK